MTYRAQAIFWFSAWLQILVLQMRQMEGWKGPPGHCCSTATSSVTGIHRVQLFCILAAATFVDLLIIAHKTSFHYEHPKSGFSHKSKHLKTQPLQPSLIAAKFKPIHPHHVTKENDTKTSKITLKKCWWAVAQNQGELENHRPRLSFPAVILSVLPGIRHVPSTTWTQGCLSVSA